MTIRNRDKFFEEHWDWGFLKEAGCFGDTKIEPTDIDGITERKGNFLFIECKSPGVPMNLGQTILHKALVATGVFTVIRLWGNAKTLNVTEIEVLSPWGNIEKKKTTTDFAIEVVKRWFARANKKA
jgi:hypothetical protein